jgi:hypothetical protein
MEMPWFVSERAECPVQVKCYSGFRYNERPCSFYHEDRELKVMDIEGSWFVEDKEGRERRACFRVRADDGHLYLLSCDEGREDWILHRIWKFHPYVTG